MKQSEALRFTQRVLSEGTLADRLTKSRVSTVTKLLRQNESWLRHDGIQGLGIARRITAGITLQQRTLKVYVERKLPKSKLGEMVIPPKITIPDLELDVPIDVEAIGHIRAQNYRHHKRPLHRGLSIGLSSGEGGGTLGCFVRKHHNSVKTYLLSNAHVLQDFNELDSKHSIYQPAVKWGNESPSNVVASLSEAVPLTFNNNEISNRVDAAIAVIGDSIKFNSSLHKGASGGFREGTKVILRGASSGTSIGKVKSTSTHLNIHYPGSGLSARFKGLVLCTPFSEAGDSGSIVLNLNNDKVLGLLIAGSEAASAFIPIQHVLAELAVDLVISDDEGSILTASHDQSDQPYTAPEMERWQYALDRASTKGCSERTMRPGGVAASQYLAEADLRRANVLKNIFINEGVNFSIPPSLLAAIASRESRVGINGILDRHGFGDNGNGFGIMQVDRRHHDISGLSDPRGLLHIRQASSILASFRDLVKQKHIRWSDANVLKGAIVAYNSGVSNVKTIREMDIGTTHDDYSSDVISRAKYYKNHGYG